MYNIKKQEKSHNDDVFNLVRDIYLTEKYSFPKEDFIKYNSNRTLFTFYRNNDLIGTISLIAESEHCSLPLSSLYAQELGEVKKQNKKIFEVGNFVMDKRKIAHRFSKDSLLGTRMLFRAIYEEARTKKADALVVVVNPKHLSFYKILGFVQFGEQKHYEFVNNAAVPLILSLRNQNFTEGFLARI